MILPLVISWIAEKPCNKIGLSKGQLTIPFSKKQNEAQATQPHVPRPNKINLLIMQILFHQLELFIK